MITSADTGIDLIAVYRLLSDTGPRPVLARHEQLYATHVLTAEGRSITDIAELLGVTSRTINRWRAQPVTPVPEPAPAAAAPWEDRARCREVGAALFFPDDDEGFVVYAPARRVCASCPVRPECLEAALAREGDVGTKYRGGMWGGLSPGQRAAVAATRNKATT